MPATAGSISPIHAVSGVGGTAVPFSMVIPMDVSETISDGDIIVMDTATRDAKASNTATADIYGVAQVSRQTNAVSAATVDRDFPPGPDVSGNYHSVNVVLALPGVLWEGSLVDTNANETGVYVNNLRPDTSAERYDFNEEDGMACIDVADSTGDTVIPIAYLSPQFDAVTPTNAPGYGREAGVGLINPRVLFFISIADTIFN